MCLPSEILSIKKDVANIATPIKQVNHLDYSLCYQAWYDTKPNHWLVITCADDRIAGRVVSAFYDRKNSVKGFPKPVRTIRRGAVVYLLKGVAS